MNNLSSRMQSIDALRGIAALAVVFFHSTLDHDKFSRFFRFGTTGVDLFFIISGFVIFMSLRKVDSLKTFVINRFCRLYPAYWMGVLLSFSIIYLHFHYTRKYPLEEPIPTLLANLTMFQYYLGYHDLEGPYWTMIVEMLFYIFMGLLFWLKKLHHIFTIGVVCCLTLMGAAFFVDQIGWLKEVFMQAPLLYHFPLFFAGIVFFALHRQEISTSKALILLLVAFISQMALFPHTWRACKHMSQPEYFVILLLFFSAFYAFTQNKLNFICNRFTLFLGKISFPLYLTHQYISINLIIPYCMWKYEMSLVVASLFVALPAVILIATVIHYLIENPGSKFLKKVLTGKQASS